MGLGSDERRCSSTTMMMSSAARSAACGVVMAGRPNCPRADADEELVLALD